MRDRTHALLLVMLASVGTAAAQSPQPAAPAPAPSPAQPRPMPSMHLPRRHFMNPAPAPAKPATPATPSSPNGSPGSAPIVQPLPGSGTPQGVPAVLPNTFNAPQGVLAVLPTGFTTPRGVTFTIPNTGTTPQGVPASLSSAFDAGVQRDVLLVNGGGFSAAGRIEGERFRLGFTVGSNPFYFDRFGQTHSVIPCASICGQTIIYHQSFGWYSPYWYAYSYRGLVVGYESRIDPQYVDPFVGTGAPGVGSPGNPQPVPAAPPATAAERGAMLLQTGLVAEAMDAYKEHLVVHEGDVRAIRGYALALLMNRQVAQGVAMMALAYDRDAGTLAADPISSGSLQGGDGALRTLVTTASAHANDVRTGSAWLTVAVLMQGEGRTETALRQIKKARDAGLAKDIAESMEKALKR